LDVDTLEQRKLVYLEAKNKNPARWSKDIRSLGFIDKVELNSEMKFLAAWY
jgi:hypothetical protein